MKENHNDTPDILRMLRKNKGLSQDELAAELSVTRQAVSKWENGESLPGPDLLKSLSALFQVSINTLLGQPMQLFCQCCGMPLEDSIIARESDQSLNEKYCKWCYENGEFHYKDMKTMLDYLTAHFPVPPAYSANPEQYWKEYLMTLEYWKNQCSED